MPLSHLDHVAFLVPGNYEDEDPARGLEETLRLIVHGERLGYDSAWVRQRHLERGISSAATFLAAATQRTTRIGLGTAVIQLGYENPFRLAEDLATVDVLSGGRLAVGVSVGPPLFAALIAPTRIRSTGLITAMGAPSGSPRPCPPSRCRTDRSAATRRGHRCRACAPSRED